MTSWTLLVPAKPLPAAKSRLAREDAAELALAFVSDTVEAALGVAAVARVVVVTADDTVAERARMLGADVARDDAGDAAEPLNAALAAAAASVSGPVAVLLGDLPGLLPADLSRALELASAHESAFVADTEGMGTTLLVAREARALTPRFGENSRERHRDAGAVELELGGTSTLRRDVDTLEALDAVARRLGVGWHTRRVLGVPMAGRSAERG